MNPKLIPQFVTFNALRNALHLPLVHYRRCLFFPSIVFFRDGLAEYVFVQF